MPQLVVFSSIKLRIKIISLKTKSYSNSTGLKNKKKSSLKKTVAFAAEGSSNSDTDKIIDRMDAMTMKMDAQYKDFQSRSRQPNLDNDDIPMSREEEAKFMQTLHRTRFYNDYRNRDSNRDNWLSNERNNYNRDNYQSHSDDKYDLHKQLSDFIKAQHSIEPRSKILKLNSTALLRSNMLDLLDLFLVTLNLTPKVVHQNLINHYKHETNIDGEDDEPIPRPEPKTPKPVKETPIPKPYKPKIPYPQRLRKEKIEAQYRKFLDMIRAIRINVPLVDVLTEMPSYGKFLKELVNNKHKIEKKYAAFLSDEISAILQNKVPPKLRDPKSFLIPCNFNKAFSCNALADLGASINLIPYSLYAKLSLETLKPTKMSVGKFTFPANFVILEMEEDNKVPLILGRPFLHTADAVIRVKQKQLNLKVGTERMIFHIDFTMKHSYSNEDTCFSIDFIDEILEKDFDALIDEGSEILHSIEGTILEEKLFA
ncbi:reverse transcriptase domain-containing protein [Tanacetum coccineum]